LDRIDQKNEYGQLSTYGTAYLLVILAAVLWGTIGIYIKKLSGFGFSTQQMVLTRAVAAALTTALFYSVKNKRLAMIKPRDVKYFIGTGIFSFVLMNCCYFIAIKETSLAVAAILLYTAPAIVMVLSIILFKEKLTKRKLLSFFLTFAGCVLVTLTFGGGEQKITFLGVLAGLGSGLGYALYSIFGRYALEKYDSITVTLYTFIFASIGMVPFADMRGMAALFSNMDALVCAVLLGVTATTLPFLLYTRGLSYLETSRASIVATLEPIVAALFGIFIFGEPVTPFKLLGILSVISAVFIIRK
jgi:drug/metabolite transporter (DMT)-like permease